MAKKQKPKKAGMARRKQQKQQQKAVQRRKSRSNRPAAITNERQLQKLLSTLPLLAFDPALDDLRMGADVLKSLQDQQIGIAEPLLFTSLLTESFLSDLDDRLEDMEAQSSPNSPRGMLIRATQHQLQNSEEIPYLSNPLLVAIYLRTRADVLGEPLSREQITQAMDDFEERNTEFIEAVNSNPELLRNLGQEALLEAEGPDDTGEPPSFEERESPVPLEVLEAFWGQLSVSEDDLERITDDLELFLDDFVPAPCSEWTPETIESFMGDWFINNANPLEEDLESMKSTLATLLRYLLERRQVRENLSEALKNLEDPERYRALLKH